MVTRSTLLAAALLITTAGACAAPTADDGASESLGERLDVSPDLSTVFATPKGDGLDDPTLENAMLDLLTKAAPGSSVRVAIYGWNRVNVAQAFVDASKRGVDVRIVLDTGVNKDAAGNANGAVQLLAAGLPAGALTLCARGDGSCIGDNINHNKFLLFSQLTDGSHHVVVQSSANFTKSQLGEHNNAVIIRNDKKLYDGYASYFGDLVVHRLNLDYNRTLEGTHVRTYVFPRAAGDTVVNILDNVRCQKGVSTVRVAMAFFTESRKDVAEQLVRLQRKGCDVRIAMRKAGDGPVDASIIDRFVRAGIDIGLYPSETGNNIHSKYLLVDSPYEGTGGVTRRALVFTGSHNLTGTALRHNDETLARVDDPAVFAAFASNWTTIRAQAK